MPKDAKIRHTQLEPLAFKIAAASSSLTSIPKRLPTNTSSKNRLELHAQTFLFFSSGAIEVIKREINTRFEIFDKENVFYIHGLRKHLLDNGMQGKIKKIISDYFSTPEYNGRPDTKNSSLWRLQTLRNQALHGNIINIARNRLQFEYTIRFKHEQAIRFTESTENPYEYFGQLFCDLCEFVSRIKKTANARYRLRVEWLQIYEYKNKNA